ERPRLDAPGRDQLIGHVGVGLGERLGLGGVGKYEGRPVRWVAQRPGLEDPAILLGGSDGRQMLGAVRLAALEDVPDIFVEQDVTLFGHVANTLRVCRDTLLLWRTSRSEAVIRHAGCASAGPISWWAPGAWRARGS